MPIQLAPNAAFRLFATDQLSVCDDLARNACLNQPVKQFAFPEASVEAIADFVKIAFEVLVRYTTMSTSDHALGIGYQSMYPRQEISSVLRFSLYVNQPVAFS